MDGCEDVSFKQCAIRYFLPAEKIAPSNLSLIFKGLTARRLYKLFGVKELNCTFGF
jgi:hypothetical protein